MISPKTLKLKDKESSARLVQFDCSVSVNSIGVKQLLRRQEGAQLDIQ